MKRITVLLANRMRGIRKRVKSPCSAAPQPKESHAQRLAPLGQILIVQVSGWSCDSLAVLLRSSGYACVVVCEEQAAYDALQQGTPVLLIVGGPAGPQLYGQLRCSTAAPILALAPTADCANVVAALEAGVDDFQSGLINDQEVAARVNTLMRRTHLNRR